MNHLVLQAGLSDHIYCDSAGTSSYHIGSPSDQRMSAAAVSKLGIKLLGQARQFQTSDFQEFDLIMAMDKDNYENILAVGS
jgi:protein-tyrosine phosphatase